jgi:hypothetical protein
MNHSRLTKGPGFPCSRNLFSLSKNSIFIYKALTKLRKDSSQNRQKIHLLHQPPTMTYCQCPTCHPSSSSFSPGSKQTTHAVWPRPYPQNDYLLNTPLRTASNTNASVNIHSTTSATVCRATSVPQHIAISTTRDVESQRACRRAETGLCYKRSQIVFSFLVVGIVVAGIVGVLYRLLKR